jgi:hypothetical protein
MRVTAVKIEETHDTFKYRKSLCNHPASSDKIYVSKVQNGERIIRIVRDDLLCGGTKGRFLQAALERIVRGVPTKLVYVSNPYGGAQVALAACAMKIPLLRVQIASEYVDTVPQRLARDMGLEFNPNPTKKDGYILPNGLNMIEVCNGIEEMCRVLSKTYGQFDEVWILSASGTILKTVSRTKLAQRYHAVDVFNRKLKAYTPWKDMPNNIIHHDAGLPLEEVPPLADRSPFPSFVHYDAKAWKVMMDNAKGNHILFWNVM